MANLTLPATQLFEGQGRVRQLTASRFRKHGLLAIGGDDGSQLVRFDCLTATVTDRATLPATLSASVPPLEVGREGKDIVVPTEDNHALLMLNTAKVTHPPIHADPPPLPPQDTHTSSLLLYFYVPGHSRMARRAASNSPRLSRRCAVRCAASSSPSTPTARSASLPRTFPSTRTLRTVQHCPLLPTLPPRKSHPAECPSPDPPTPRRRSTDRSTRSPRGASLSRRGEGRSLRRGLQLRPCVLMGLRT